MPSRKKTPGLLKVAGVPATHDPVVRAPLPYRDVEFDAEEIEWFTSEATVVQLATWYQDMLESDSDMECRSRRTRQLREIIARRGLAEELLGASHVVDAEPADQSEPADDVIDLRPRR